MPAHQFGRSGASHVGASEVVVDRRHPVWPQCPALGPALFHDSHGYRRELDNRSLESSPGRGGSGQAPPALAAVPGAGAGPFFTTPMGIAGSWTIAV